LFADPQKELQEKHLACDTSFQSFHVLHNFIQDWALVVPNFMSSLIVWRL